MRIVKNRERVLNAVEPVVNVQNAHSAQPLKGGGNEAPIFGKVAT